MRLVARRAGWRCGFAVIMAVVLCLGPVFSSVQAQDASPTATNAIASSGEAVLLRDQPGYDAASLATLADGTALEVMGDVVTAGDGTVWAPVVANGQSGYVPAGYVGAPTAVQSPPDAATAPEPSQPSAAAGTAAPATGTTAATNTDANVRSAPSMDADVLTTLPSGMTVTIDGPAENGFVPVSGSGGSGWVAAELLGDGAASSAPAPAAPAPVADPNTPFTATTMADANLRAAPDPSSAILTMVPAGSTVQTTGGPQNSYFPVEFAGQVGWVDGTALAIEGSGTTAITPASVDVSPPPSTTLPDPVVAPPVETPEEQRARRGESTGIVWPFAGGEWEVVQGYNGGTHTNRGGFAQYKYSLDWARVDGDTAGQPVFAPVSGTVRWTDRGSGGLLVDAGNGFGVALFHVTLNGLSRGDRVDQGQRIGTISGPGDDGYMSMAHIEIAAWRLTDNGHESVPFVGPNAVAGQEYPDGGGANQHMGARVSP